MQLLQQFVLPFGQHVCLGLPFVCRLAYLFVCPLYTLFVIVLFNVIASTQPASSTKRMLLFPCLSFFFFNISTTDAICLGRKLDKCLGSPVPLLAWAN